MQYVLMPYSAKWMLLNVEVDIGIALVDNIEDLRDDNQTDIHVYFASIARIP